MQRSVPFSQVRNPTPVVWICGTFWWTRWCSLYPCAHSSVKHEIWAGSNRCRLRLQNVDTIVFTKAWRWALDHWRDHDSDTNSQFSRSMVPQRTLYSPNTNYNSRRSLGRTIICSQSVSQSADDVDLMNSCSRFVMKVWWAIAGICQDANECMMNQLSCPKSSWICGEAF